MYYPNSLKVKVNTFTLYQTRFKSRSNIFYTLATAMAAAQLNYVLFGPVAYAVVFILLSHEFAHYIYGKSNGGQAYYPFIVPLPFILIGLTIVRDLTDQAKAHTALSGMFYGALASLIILLNNILLPLFSPLLFLFIIFWEFFYNYFIGTDGKTYKNYTNK